MRLLLLHLKQLKKGEMSTEVLIAVAIAVTLLVVMTILNGGAIFDRLKDGLTLLKGK